MNYYTKHIGDYTSKTSHLTLLQHGIYNRMLDVYYSIGHAIPVADAERLIGIRSRPEKEAFAIVTRDFFVIRDCEWHNARADQELESYRRKVDYNRKNGVLGGRPITKVVSENNPDVTQVVSENNPNQEPITNNQYKDTIAGIGPRKSQPEPTVEKQPTETPRQEIANPETTGTPPAELTSKPTPTAAIPTAIQPRQPNPLWDAVAKNWFDGNIPDRQKSRVGKLVSELKQLAAAPGDVETAYERMRRMWPNVAPTPEAVVKHWVTLKNWTVKQPGKDAVKNEHIEF